MIREFATCPFCSRGALAVDDDGPTFVFEPDRPNGGPCPHLALATAMYACEDSPTSTSAVNAKRGVWWWSYGDGLRGGPKAQGHELGFYLMDLACDDLRHPQLFPIVPYRFDGGTAGDREERRKGSGYFSIASDKGLLEGSLDGWALYTHDPAALIRDVYKRLDLWKQMD